MSSFHFQRAFKAIVGETVACHGQRLRLERAASLLKFSAWQVQEIGLEAGFDTQTSFCRAFKKLYGCTPQDFRSRQSVVPFLRGHMRSRKTIDGTEEAFPLPTAQVETWPDISVVAIRHYGAVNSLHLPWGELLQWVRENHPDPVGARYFGLWFDDWSDRPVKNPAYRYEPAVTLPANWREPLPEPFHLRTLPAGLVATALAHGNIAALDRAWRSFGYGWLPYSGFQPREDYVIDEYPAELVLSSVVKKITASLLGLTLKMCLPVQNHRSTSFEI